MKRNNLKTAPLAKKEKTDLSSVKKLFVFCRPYLPSIIIALILAVAGTVTTIIGPNKISAFMRCYIIFIVFINIIFWFVKYWKLLIEGEEFCELKILCWVAEDSCKLYFY